MKMTNEMKRRNATRTRKRVRGEKKTTMGNAVVSVLLTLTLATMGMTPSAIAFAFNDANAASPASSSSAASAVTTTTEEETVQPNVTTTTSETQVDSTSSSSTSNAKNDSTSSSSAAASDSASSAASSTEKPATSDASSASAATEKRTISKSIKSADGTIYIVEIAFDETAGIPDDAQLDVVEYVQIPDDYAEKKDTAYKDRPYETERFLSKEDLTELSSVTAKGMNVDEHGFVFFNQFLNLSIMSNGQAIQLQAPVKVTVDTNAASVDESDALEVGMLAYDEVLARDSQALEDGRVTKDGKSARDMQRVNVTGEREEKTGEIPADRGAVKLQFQTDKLGEMALVGIVEPRLFVETEDAGTVTALAARTFAVDSQDVSVQVPEGREAAAAFRLTTNPEPNYGSKVWLTYAPEGEAATGYLVKNGELSNELFSKNGTPVPATIESGDSIALVRRVSTDDATSADAAGTVPGANPDANAGDSSQTDPTVLEKTLTWDGHTYKVQATYGPETGIPATGTYLVANRYQKGSAEYDKYIQQAATALGVDPSQVSGVPIDISIVDNNLNTCNPAEGTTVDVSVTLLDNAAQSIPEGDSRVVHFDAEGEPEVITAKASSVDGGARQVTFETKGFSVFLLLGPAETKGTTDGNTNGNTRNDPAPLLTKKLSDLEGSWATWTITVNPDATKLNEAAGQQLTLTDTFTENQSIDYSSIQVTSGVTYDYSSRTGTFIIPDATAAEISYRTRVTANPGDTVHFGNTATLSDSSGKELATETKEEGHVIYPSASDVAVTTGEYLVRFYVYGNENMQSGIPGAQFILLNEDRRPMTYKVSSNGHNAGDPVTFTTDSDGFADIKIDKVPGEISIEKNTQYYVEMIKSPEGYKKDNSVYGFVIKDNPDYGRYEYYNGDTLKVRLYPEAASLNVSKRFSGNYSLTNAEQNGVTFILQKRNGADWENIESHQYAEFNYGSLTFNNGKTDKPFDVGSTYRVIEMNERPYTIPEEVDLNTTYYLSIGSETADQHKEPQEFTITEENKDKSFNVVIDNEYEKHELTITKMDKMTGAKLPGAVFTAKKVKDGSTATTYTTDESGVITISGGSAFESETLYSVEETTAPTDYLLPITPVKTYFYFCNDPAREPSILEDLPAGETAFNLTETYASITLDNQREKITVPVMKTWQGNEWPSNVKSVEVWLYKSVGGADPVVVTDEQGNPRTVTLTKEAPYNNTAFTNLPSRDGNNTITYSIQEKYIYTTGNPSQNILSSYVQEYGISDAGVYVVRNSPATTLTVNKEWYNGQEKVTDPATLAAQSAVTFDIYRSTTKIDSTVAADGITNEEMEEFVATLTKMRSDVKFGSSDNWQKKIIDLPEKDDRGYKYYYYILETIPSFGTEVYEVNEDSGTVTIKNQVAPQAVKVTVKKAELVDDPRPEALNTNFEFTLALNNERHPIRGYEVAEGLVTDKNGEVTFKLKPQNPQATSTDYYKELNLPVGVTATVTEAANPEYVELGSSPDGLIDLDTTNDRVFKFNVETSANEKSVQFTNTLRVICKVIDDNGYHKPFESFKSALKYIRDNPNDFSEQNPVTIYMLEDYTMPATDEFAVLTGENIKLTTAPTTGTFPFKPNRPAGDPNPADTAIITRGADDGSMLINASTLTLEKVILDGAKDSYTISADGGFVNNSGTLSLTDTVKLRNSSTTGKGGAIYSTGTINMPGGSITGNSATNGSAVYLASGTINMTGGSIDNNTSAEDGAVVPANIACRINLSGNPVIFGNRNSNDDWANIYLGVDSDQVINVVNPGLAADANIGVRAMETHNDIGEQFASAEYEKTNNLECFVNDLYEYRGKLKEGTSTNVVWDGLTLKLKKEFGDNARGANANDTFTITLSSSSIKRGSYTIHGSLDYTVTPARGGNPGTIVFRNVKAGNEIDISPLPKGEYTISENASNYTPTYSGKNTDSGTDLTIDNGKFSLQGNSTVTATNTRRLADVNLSKELYDRLVGQDAVHFGFTAKLIDADGTPIRGFTLADGGTPAITTDDNGIAAFPMSPTNANPARRDFKVPVGATMTIEDHAGDNYHVTVSGQTILPSEQPEEITDEDTDNDNIFEFQVTDNGAAVAFSNERKMAKIDLGKELTGKVSKTESFEITVTLSEKNGSEYEPVANYPLASGITTDEHGQAHITFAFTDESPDSVRLTVPYGTKLQAAETEVTKVIDGTARPIYDTTYSINEGAAQTGLVATIDSVSDTDKSIVFSNARKMKTVTVTNTVAGYSGNVVPFTYTATVTDGGQGQDDYDEHGFVDGVQTFELTTGQSKTLTVPYGSDLTIEESFIVGYKTTVRHGSTDKGTVLKDEFTVTNDVTVAFTNTQLIGLRLANKTSSALTNVRVDVGYGTEIYRVNSDQTGQNKINEGSKKWAIVDNIDSGKTAILEILHQADVKYEQPYSVKGNTPEVGYLYTINNEPSFHEYADPAVLRVYDVAPFEVKGKLRYSVNDSIVTFTAQPLVSFDANGGVWTTEMDGYRDRDGNRKVYQMAVTSGEKVAKPNPDPVYAAAGIDFLGWTTDKEYAEADHSDGNVEPSKLFDFENTEVTGPVNLYAIWKKGTAANRIVTVKNATATSMDITAKLTSTNPSSANYTVYDDPDDAKDIKTDSNGEATFNLPAGEYRNLTVPDKSKLALSTSAQSTIAYSPTYADDDSESGSFTINSVEQDGTVAFIAGICKITDSSGNVLYDANGMPTVYTTLTDAFTAYDGALYTDATHTTAATPAAVKMLIDEYTITSKHSFPTKSMVLTTAGKNDLDFPYAGVRDRSVLYRGSSFTNDSLFALEGNSARTVELTNIVLDGSSKLGVKVQKDKKGELILMSGANGVLTVNSGTTMRNVEYAAYDNANSGGGAIRMTNGTLYVSAGEFSNLHAYQGGAICSTGGQLNVTGTQGSTRFEDCRSERQDGGAIYYNNAQDLLINGGVDKAKPGIIFTRCVGAYTNGTGDGSDGGAIFATSNYTNTVTVKGCSFVECSARTGNGSSTAGYGGGGICGYKVKGLTVKACTFESCDTLCGGGAVAAIVKYTDAVDNNTVTIENCSFNQCNCKGQAGALGVYQDNNGATNSATKLSVIDSTFNNCSSGTNNGSGGAIQCYLPCMVFTNSHFTDCWAGKEGGAVNNFYGSDYQQVWAKSSTTLTNCRFIRCRAEDRYDTTAVQHYGGGVNTKAKNVTVTGSYFEDCVSTLREGGALHIGGQGGGSTAMITGSTFKNCAAKNGGGALLSSHETLTIDECNFYGCSSSASKGGAVYHTKSSRGDSTQSNTTISNSVFGADPDDANSAGCSAAQNGGAIWTRAAMASITGCTISDCVANNGGAIYLSKEKTASQSGAITNGSIKDCQAVSGSAVYVENKATFSGCLSVTDNTVSNINDGAIRGGTLYFEGNVKVENNTCSEDNTYNHDVLMQNNNLTTIQTTSAGLGDKAHIGVYVPDENDRYKKYGLEGQDFGTYADGGNAYLENFFNDRDDELFGYQNSNGGVKYICWGRYLCKITDADGNTLTRPNGRPAVYQRLTLALDDFTSVSGGDPVYIKMLVENYNIWQTDTISNFPIADITLTTAGPNDESYPYRGSTGTVCTISRVNNKNQLFKLNTSGAKFQLKDITLDGRKNKSATQGDYRLIEAAQGTLIINEGTTLQYGAAANGGAIDASENAQVRINGKYDADKMEPTVKFINCSGTGGDKPNGGAIRAYNLNIYNSTDEKGKYGTAFINCSAHNGGAITALGSSMEINGALFDSCHTRSGGGAVYHNNSSDNTSTTIKNCAFESCLTNGDNWAHGGAIEARTATLNVEDSSFNDCHASSDGGAVYHGYVDNKNKPLGNRDTTSINNTTFNACYTNGADTAYNYGGSVYTQAKTIEVIDSIIQNSTAKNHGGAIYCQSNVAESTAIISGTRIENCSSTLANGSGGAIYSRGKTLTLQKHNGNESEIENCTAQGYSGAVYMETNGSTLNIMDSTLVSGCYANRGGAIYLKSGVTLNLSGSPEFTKNGYTTINGTVVNAEKGACIYLEEDSTINLQGGPKFSRNNITDTGTKSQPRVTNGGITDFVRQDLYLAGYSGKHAASINVIGELTGDTIWVWPENSPHRLAGDQFATTADTIPNQSLNKLRNALADSATGCSHGEFLAGIRLSDMSATNVYWSKMHVISFNKKDNKGVMVPGAGFTLYTEASCSPESAYASAFSADGVDDTGADGSLLDKGVVEFGSIPIGVYYMKETTVPVSFRSTDTIYLVLVGSPYLSPNDGNRYLWEGNGPLNVEHAATLVARNTTDAGKFYGIFALQPDAQEVLRADVSKSAASPTVGVINIRSDYEAYFMKADGSYGALPGASFTIYVPESVDAQGNPTSFYDETSKYPKLQLWSRDGENYPDPVVSADGSSNFKMLDGSTQPKGMVYFRELPIGTYYLVETEYPTRDGNGRIAFYVEDDRVFRLQVRGVDSAGQNDFTLSEWQEGGTYEEVEKRTYDGKDYFTVRNADAVCKLTDNDNNLLYKLGHDGETKLPAVYSTLEAGFAAAQSDGLVSSSSVGVASDAALKLKALKDFTLGGPVTYNSSRDLTFTTAERKATTDKYVFATNRTSDTSRAEIKRNSNGAALITVDSGANLTMQNINLNGQKSSFNGGAVHVKDGSLNIQDHTQLQGFKSDGKGGAVLMDDGTSLIVNGGSNRSAVFTNNEVNGDGGAISIGDNCLFSIVNAQFTGNKATSAAENAGNGGAVSIAKNSTTGDKRAITLQNVVFNSNAASNQGGAVYTGPNYGMTLQNADIHSNEASYGSAVYVGSNVDLTVTNGSISGNKASAVNGGAINGAESNNKFIFVGAPVVYDNIGTGDLSAQQKNVVLSQDSNGIINTTEAGLLEAAKIGIYVIDGEGGNIFKNHGNPSTPFGTFVTTENELNLASFKNDRDDTLYGVRNETDDSDVLIYWSALQGSGKVILRKISDSYDSLGGAVFEIHKGSATGSLVTSKDINGVETTSFTSDSSGVYFVDTLSYGTYYIKETTVPDGYSSLDGVNWFILTVSEDGIGYKQADESIVGQIRPEETTP